MKYILIVFAILISSITLVSMSFIQEPISYFQGNIEKLAQLGDFFGGILNPIFAFFAFLALLVTIKLQIDALNISKDELSATRKELEKSRIAQQEQSKSLKLQNQATKLQMFENTFFQLNELFNDRKNSLAIKVDIFMNDDGFSNGSGGQVTEYFGIDDNDYYLLDCIKTSKFISYEVIERYLYIYKKRYKTWGYDEFNVCYEKFTGSYFGLAYQVLKYIDKSNLSKEEKNRYANIFRAQFTKDELEFLFYHCLGSIGRRHFKEYVENYEFFEHILLNDDIEKQLLEYNIKAFGRNEKILEKYKELKSKT